MKTFKEWYSKNWYLFDDDEPYSKEECAKRAWNDAMAQKLEIKVNNKIIDLETF